MGFHDFGALRVSPQFTTQDWEPWTARQNLIGEKLQKSLKTVWMVDSSNMPAVVSSLRTQGSSF